MSRLGVSKRRVLWLGLVLLAGCNRQDADHLAKVGQILVQRGEQLGRGVGERVSHGIQSLRGEVEDVAVDARVAARLRWEKVLAEAALQVSPTETGVELKGQVRELAQRRRAVELAESTVGVEKVADSIAVEAKDP